MGKTLYTSKKEILYFIGLYFFTDFDLLDSRRETIKENIQFVTAVKDLFFTTITFSHLSIINVQLIFMFVDALHKSDFRMILECV